MGISSTGNARFVRASWYLALYFLIGIIFSLLPVL
jgi:hypothetical protein